MPQATRVAARHLDGAEATLANENAWPCPQSWGNQGFIEAGGAVERAEAQPLIGFIGDDLRLGVHNTHSKHLSLVQTSVQLNTSSM